MRAWVAAAAVAAVAAAQHEASAASYDYPGCTTPEETNCAMQAQRPTDDSSGSVTVYTLFYGSNFQNGGIDGYTALDIEALVFALSQSSAEATIGTYTNVTSLNFTSVVDAYSQGHVLVDDGTANDGVSNAIQAQITSGQWPADPNGVYMLVPDQTVTLSGGNITACPSNAPPTGTCACGWNNVYSDSGGPSIKYGVVINSSITPACAYGSAFATPNNANGQDTNGAIDGELKFFAHELNEALTEHWTLSSPPVASDGTAPNNQEADFCQGQTGTTYTVQNSPTNALANFHGFGFDFLIQPNRVNLNTTSGNEGYCANSYGGVFWGKDFGTAWNPLSGDWSPYNYKGECESGQPLVGVSTNTSTGIAHAIFCGSGPETSFFPQSNSCHQVNFDGFNGAAGTVQPAASKTADAAWWTNGDWDYKYYKGECAPNEFVAGISQSQQGGAATLLCCPSSVAHESCDAQPFNSSNAGNAETDWDFAYYKAECSNGQYVAGISVDTTHGHPHELLCCSPASPPPPPLPPPSCQPASCPACVVGTPCCNGVGTCGCAAGGICLGL
jgi:hypothetical protein